MTTTPPVELSDSSDPFVKLMDRLGNKLFEKEAHHHLSMTQVAKECRKFKFREWNLRPIKRELEMAALVYFQSADEVITPNVRVSLQTEHDENGGLMVFLRLVPNYENLSQTGRTLPLFAKSTAPSQFSAPPQPKDKEYIECA